MSTWFITHPVFEQHDTGLGHPECAERVRAVNAALGKETFSSLVRKQAEKGSLDDVLKVHNGVYVDALRAAVPSVGTVHLDADTVVSPASWDAALYAVGATVQAVRAVMDGVANGGAQNAFCAVRPPGHHAEADRAMGFCLFNNAAVGARVALDDLGARKVAILDFDVHHGNGSQSVANRHADIFYASSHQSPAYPGSGGRDERGCANNALNVPLAPGSGRDAFRDAWAESLLPTVEAFAPDLVIVSAGFDAHVRDPLASLALVEADYGWLSDEIVALAERVCAGRVVSVLEGGYDLQGLATSVEAHVLALMAAERHVQG